MNLELVYPMAALVLLTFLVIARTFFGRIQAVKAGETDAVYFKTYQEGGESRQGAQRSRNVINLFEAPTLFYAACVAGMITGQNSGILVVLAWTYVASRVVHSYIHTGKNKIQPRIAAYFSGWLVLLGMWGTLVAGVATA